LDTFTHIPGQFLWFCYPLGDASQIDTPRLVVARILRMILLTPGVADAILERVISTSVDAIEAEARLFLLSISMESRRDDPSLFQWIRSFILSDNPPFLIATALFALQYLTIENQRRNELSIELLVRSNSPAVQLLAVMLFQNTFDTLFPLSQPLDILIATLIQLANVVRDPKPGEMIDLLFRHFPEAFLPSAEGLIIAFLQTWMHMGVDNEQLGGTDLLRCVRGLIDALPFDSDILSQITIPIAGLCCSQIVENPESRSEVQLLEILTSLVNQQSCPPIVLFESLNMFLPYFSRMFRIASTLAPDFAGFFLALLSSRPFFEPANGDYVQQLVAICDVCITHLESPASAAIGFLLLTDLLQIGGTPFLWLVDRAVWSLSKPGLPSPVIVASFALLASGLLSVSAEVIKMTTPDVAEHVIAEYTVFATAPLNYLTLAFSGLCILARHGSSDAFLAAAGLIPAIVEKKTREQIADTEDESLLAELPAGALSQDRELDIFAIDLPSDSFDYVALFSETLAAIGSADILPPDTRALLESGQFVF
jgi:hypothetical protein